MPGLSNDQIDQYQFEIGFNFPEIYRKYLQTMNGTDEKTINIYGDSDHQYKYGVGYYSYPRDLETVKDMINEVYEAFRVTHEEIDSKGIPHIIPIVSHRFLVIDKHENNPVLSIYGDDAIYYSSSLQQFLVDDIFHNHRQEESAATIAVNFWTT